MSWVNINKEEKSSHHYSIMKAEQNEDRMALLRQMFPGGKANDLNFCLFSTSGVHGTYNTIEEAEEHLNNPSEESCGEVTFLIIHPRIVCLKYGNCNPENIDDINFLKSLRKSSHDIFSTIGI